MSQSAGCPFYDPFASGFKSAVQSLAIKGTIVADLCGYHPTVVFRPRQFPEFLTIALKVMKVV